MLLAATEFKNEMAKLAIDITKGGCDPEVTYNRLKDAMSKLDVDLDICEERVLEGIWFESTTAPATGYSFEQWKRRMGLRRHNKKQLERIRERNAQMKVN
jgi:hypothetical protein